MMISTDVQDFWQEVVRKFQPEKVTLFGSYTYGTPNQHSDVDLLVVIPFECHPAEKAVEILHAIDYHFPLGLLARTPEYLQQRLEIGDFFIKEILKKGRVFFIRPTIRNHFVALHH